MHESKLLNQNCVVLTYTLNIEFLSGMVNLTATHSIVLGIFLTHGRTLGQALSVSNPYLCFFTGMFNRAAMRLIATVSYT